MDWLWALLAAGVMGALVWAGCKIEPHWVSRDGRRMLCSGQMLNHLGMPQGRWRETRVLIDDGCVAHVDQKRMTRRTTSAWSVVAEAPAAPAGRVVFVLQSSSGEARRTMMAVKLPATSRAVQVLRGCIAT